MPCNPDFLTRKGGKDYVICHKVGERAVTCPITHLKFTNGEDNDGNGATYIEKKGEGDAKNATIYISHDFMQHGIEHVTIAAKTPCQDRGRYNAAPNQQFWFAEIRRLHRSCETDDDAFAEVPDQLGLTEWDVQIENGVLTRMDDTMHTSFSFFPSSAIKKEVSLKFYQRPITNYKLECDIKEERSLKLLDQNHNIIVVMGRANGIANVLWNVNAMSVSSLVVLIVVPIATGQATFVCTPMALISVGGMYIALITWLDDAIDILAQMGPAYKQPTWFNLCQSS